MRKLEKIDCTIHYAELDLKNDIPSFKFDRRKQLQSWIDEYIIFPENNTEKVFLLTSDDGEVYVTDKKFIISAMASLFPFRNNQIHIYEFPSFEEAYHLALTFKEDNSLCYAKD